MKNPFKRFWRSERPSEAQYRPVRVEALVVEDDSSESDFLCGLLRMQNVLVTPASSIAVALVNLSGPVKHQIAFVDLNLPNGSGVEVVRRIKERRTTHVVVVSGDSDKLPLAVSHGYVGVLSKPYTISSVRDVLYHHRLLYD